MLYRTHVITSIAICLPILSYVGDLNSIAVGAVALGALLPDIDEEHSYIGRKVPIISITINKIFGHRGITHSLLVFAILFSLSTYTKSHILGGIALGYFLHLFEDYFSDAGIKWFQPFIKKDFKVPEVLRYKVGGFKEHIILIIVICILFLEINRIFYFRIYIPIVTTIFNIVWNIIGGIGYSLFRII
ncbi:metal-dependent hydrolase [Clostridium thermobutyricum]|uniref:metal-dependent hydrolase n=1 Tax=Clostridium thermobutyricum TaxID=29372 RepID=UPI0018AB7D53|nr:metal-dependent hydrolase [Clostridium thermobutyricum]